MLLIVMSVIFSPSLFASSLIQTDMRKFFLCERISMKIGQGSNSVSLMVTLDLNSQFNWISFHPVDKSDLNLMTIIQSSIEKQIKQQIITVKEVEAQFNFPNHNDRELGSMRFYSFISNSTITHGVLAMPFVFEDQSHSIIHQLKLRGLISSLQFSIVRGPYQGSFYLGGIPEEATINRTYSYCDVLISQGNSHWDCSLSRIVLTSTTNDTVISYIPLQPNNHAYFDSSYEFIYVSSDYFKLIVNYFNSSLFAQDCFLSQREYRMLYCGYNRDLFKGQLTITLGNYNYELTLAHLWQCLDVYCTLMIVENPNGNEWMLGLSFNNAYNVLFDYEQKKVNFYSNQGVTEAVNAHSQQVNSITLLILSTVVLFIGVTIAVMLKKSLIQYKPH